MSYLRLTPAAAASPGTRAGTVRVAFTGIRPGDELDRYRGLVSDLGGVSEDGDVVRSETTHCVVFPCVGARRTAKSVWAALTRKLLVPPEWLHESTRRGEFIEPGVGTPGGVVLVRGVCNPLDGQRVCLTAAFRAQHSEHATVGTLLSSQAVLLQAATLVDGAADATVVFVADDELRPERHTVYTWEAFLQREVPGHEPRGGKRKRTR